VVIVVHRFGQHMDGNLMPADQGLFLRWRFLTRELWWTPLRTIFVCSEPAAARTGCAIHRNRRRGPQLGAIRATFEPGTRVFFFFSFFFFFFFFDRPRDLLRAHGGIRAARKVLLIALARGRLIYIPLRARLESLPRPANRRPFPDLRLCHRSLRDAGSAVFFF